MAVLVIVAKGDAREKLKRSAVVSVWPGRGLLLDARQDGSGSLKKQRMNNFVYEKHHQYPAVVTPSPRGRWLG